MFESKINPAWYDAASKRRSVRQYTASPTEAQLAQLGTLAKQLSWQGVRIMLMKGSGLKGTIKGTDVYAAVIAQKNTPQELEGYVGEALALEATLLGLGTCWLGGSFYKGVVRQVTKLQEGESVHCVIAIGQCAEAAPAHRRKDMAKLCSLDEAALTALPAWQGRALQCARIAPSAINLQPWKFTATDKTVAVVKAGFSPYAALDRGIAMLHVAAGAVSAGVNGVWKEAGEGWAYHIK